jgi:hypothetical protein
MSGIELSQPELKGLLVHAAKWLWNLRRAGLERKRESLEALRGVIQAVRRTTVYLRALNDGQSSLDEERELSLLWTALSFRLQDLKLYALAKKCEIKGRHWADPSAFDTVFIEKADIKLETMERLALMTLREIT